MSRAIFLPFALADIDETEFQQVRDAMLSGWVTTGPETREFETKFAAVVGAKHAIAVNSCTASPPSTSAKHMKPRRHGRGSRYVGWPELDTYTYNRRVTHP
jgi:hypothetical protein